MTDTKKNIISDEKMQKSHDQTRQKGVAGGSVLLRPLQLLYSALNDGVMNWLINSLNWTEHWTDWYTRRGTSNGATYIHTNALKQHMHMQRRRCHLHVCIHMHMRWRLLIGFSDLFLLPVLFGTQGAFTHTHHTPHNHTYIHTHTHTPHSPLRTFQSNAGYEDYAIGLHISAYNIWGSALFGCKGCSEVMCEVMWCDVWWYDVMRCNANWMR